MNNIAAHGGLASLKRPQQDSPHKYFGGTRVVVTRVLLCGLEDFAAAELPRVVGDNSS